jgi:outer membrane protein OmpA-like peptidoglycan-associated protein
MTARHSTLLLAAVGLLVGASSARAQQDVKGSKDHPVVTRMPGYYLASYRVEEFAGFDPTVIGGEVHWEGKKYTLAYDLKEGATPVSPMQIVRNYEAALKRAGATLPGGDERRTTAEIRKGGAMTGVYVEVFNEGHNYELTVVESGEMRQDVTANAAAMGKDLQASGKTIVRGVHFDTGSAAIKPDSDAAIAEMVKLLKTTPALKAAVVGHTDTVGAADANLKLSADRAAALVKALVAKGTSAGRLRAFGAGPYCPVASNRDERGRAENRRVELVEQ